MFPRPEKDTNSVNSVGKDLNFNRVKTFRFKRMRKLWRLIVLINMNFNKKWCTHNLNKKDWFSNISFQRSDLMNIENIIVLPGMDGRTTSVV